MAHGGRPWRRPARQEAQALVELAYVFPLLLLMLVGVVDFSRAFGYALQLNDAAFQGARLAALDPTATNADIEAAVRNDLAAQEVASNATITVAPALRTSGQAVTVTVSWAYGPLMPLSEVFLRSGVPLSGSGVTIVR